MSVVQRVGTPLRHDDLVSSNGSHHGTAIEWTHVPGYKGETWNPTTGCDRVSPGCAKCYALTLAKRLKAMGLAAYQRDGDPRTSGPGFGLTVHPDRLQIPLRWRKPRAVFVNSMSDLFHEEIPPAFIGDVFNVMRKTPQHLYLILTKRPERMREVLGMVPLLFELPLPNVWLGVSIENARFTWRADVLREIPAAVRFISAEPLLGSLFEKPHRIDGLSTRPGASMFAPARAPLDLTGIDWVIAGGESGRDHRPVELDHLRELRDACLDLEMRFYDDLRCTIADVVRAERRMRPAFFLKQIGGQTPKSGGKTLDGREWCEFPVRA